MILLYEKKQEQEKLKYPKSSSSPISDDEVWEQIPQQLSHDEIRTLDFDILTAVVVSKDFVTSHPNED